MAKFCREGLETYLKDSVEQFISFAYFRIPKFRKAFLDCVLKKSNEFIPEWSNTNWNINQPDPQEEEESSISHLFDWDTYFYSFVLDSQEKADAESALKRVLMNSKWQQKVEKRTVAFF